MHDTCKNSENKLKSQYTDNLFYFRIGENRKVYWFYKYICFLYICIRLFR